jgi:hypothetical protein
MIDSGRSQIAYRDRVRSAHCGDIRSASPGSHLPSPSTVTRGHRARRPPRLAMPRAVIHSSTRRRCRSHPPSASLRDRQREVSAGDGLCHVVQCDAQPPRREHVLPPRPRRAGEECIVSGLAGDAPGARRHDGKASLVEVPRVVLPNHRIAPAMGSTSIPVFLPGVRQTDADTLLRILCANSASQATANRAAATRHARQPAATPQTAVLNIHRQTERLGRVE